MARTFIYIRHWISLLTEYGWTCDECNERATHFLVVYEDDIDIVIQKQFLCPTHAAVYGPPIHMGIPFPLRLNFLRNQNPRL